MATPSWSLPKTNWKNTDYYNPVDFNRILNNTLYLHNRAEELYKKTIEISDRFYGAVGSTVLSINRADAYVDVDDAVANIIQATGVPLDYPCGNYVAGGRFLDASDLNRIESAHAILTQYFDGLANNAPRLSVRLGSGWQKAAYNPRLISHPGEIRVIAPASGKIIYTSSMDIVCEWEVIGFQKEVDPESIKMYVFTTVLFDGDITIDAIPNGYHCKARYTATAAEVDKKVNVPFRFTAKYTDGSAVAENGTSILFAWGDTSFFDRYRINIQAPVDNISVRTAYIDTMVAVLGPDIKRLHIRCNGRTFSKTGMWNGYTTIRIPLNVGVNEIIYTLDTEWITGFSASRKVTRTV